LRKENPIEGKEKEILGMEKCRILSKANPNYRTIDAIVVSPPSPQAQHMISVESIPFHTSSERPMTFSSRQVVVAD